MKKYLLVLLPLLFSAMPLAAQQISSGNPRTQRVGFLAKEAEGTSTLFFLDGTLYTCNDHGQLRLYALDTLSGKVLSSVDLGVKVYDLEEVTQDERYLYFGDFGDNRGVRKDLRILRLAKSDFRRGRYRFDTISFSYPDRASGTLARNFDCEAFAAVGDSLYLFTKQWISQGSSCYVLPKRPGNYKARRAFSLDTQGLVTAATYHPDGHQLVLLGYTLVLQPFVYVMNDFDGKGRNGGRRLLLDTTLGTQAEGIASLDGRHFFLSNETFEMAFISCKAALMKVNLAGFTSSH